jgi:PAS domain S-box-containing protein
MSAGQIGAFFRQEPEILQNDFGLYKIKVFATSGEVIYSTEPSEIGTVNDKPYFYNIVANGTTFAKLVSKNTSNLEGEIVALDVVETYVPIREGSSFAGAFEIYTNITASKQQLDHTIMIASVIPFVASLCFMGMVLFLLRRACEDIDRSRKIEEELRFHRSSLEYIITERTAELQDANDTVIRSERFLRTIFDSINDPLCIFDRDYHIVKVNEAYARIKNTTPEHLAGMVCHEAIHKKDSVCDDCLIKTTFNAGTPITKDKLVFMSDDSEAWFELYTYPIFDNDGTVTHVIEYTHEITEKKRTEMERKRLIHELEQLSRTDALTGVLNRRALALELRDEFNRAQRYGKPLSLILCDLDNLDTDIEGAAAFAERLRSQMAQIPCDLQNSMLICITLSIGVSTLAKHMKAVDDLVRPADNALYQSKNSGRNTVTLASRSVNESGNEQHIIPFD